MLIAALFIATATVDVEKIPHECGCVSVALDLFIFVGEEMELRINVRGCGSDWQRVSRRSSGPSRARLTVTEGNRDVRQVVLPKRYYTD